MTVINDGTSYADIRIKQKIVTEEQKRILLHRCPRFSISGELTCCRPCENGTGVCGPSSVRPGNYRMDNGARDARECTSQFFADLQLL